MLNERGDTMAKKGISIGILGILLLTMGTQVALGANNSLMEKTGTIFHEYSKSEKKDSEIFACGKNGAIVRVSDIKQGIEFYMASGISETEAKEKSVNFYLKREAMYQKAIQEGYDVTEQEISDYLEYLKEFLNSAENQEDFQEVMFQFDSEEEYWQYEFEVYKKDLPIINYTEALQKEFITNYNNTYSNSSVGNVMDEWNNYLEEFKSNLVAEENFEILQEIE